MIVDSSSTSTALSYHMSAIEDHHAISSFSRLGFLHLLPSAASASLDHQEELGMDTTTQWPQGLPQGKAMEEFGSSAATLRPETAEIMKAGRPPRKEQPLLKCPRCNSGNTKFCYYNNYSLTQPRYFCKACRRYWTEGGSLRNVPVGGGSRKYKKSSSSSSPSSSSSAAATAISAPGKSPVGYVNLSATTSRIPRQYMLPVEYNYINSHCSNFTPFSPMMPASSASTEFLSGFGAQELIRPAPAISFPMDGDFSAASYGPMAEEMKLAVVPSSGIHVAHQLFEENNNNRQRDELPPPAGFWSVVMNNNAGGSW